MLLSSGYIAGGAIAGILIAALGLSLLLVFEPSQPPAEGPVLRPLHDEDAV